MYRMRYIQTLEESSYARRKADFLMCVFFLAVFLLIIGPFFFGIVFLGSPLTFSMIYIWARRNPMTVMSFLGLFTFRAPYLPFVLLGFTMLISRSFPTGDLLGLFAGHLYYYLEDVYPQNNYGYRPLKTPRFLKQLLNEDVHEE